MPQTQPAIRKDIIKHPFRNIEVIYEANKTTLSSQDEELLERYISLHDFEWQMQNTAENIYRKSLEINENLESLQEELEKVQESLDVCISLADKLSEENYIIEETSMNKLYEAREETLGKLNEYNPKILAVYEAAKAMQDTFNEVNENEENSLDALYTEFSSLTMDHLANESNTINPVAFDSQFDEFREFRSTKETQREALLDNCEEVMDKYTNLNLQTTTLYNVWNEFVKRYDLLIKMYVLHNNATGFTEN